MKPVAIGAMRLSTAEDRDDERAGQVLEAALAAGVTWIDTADAYAHDEHDLGHNERLVAAAVRGRAGITVVTKGGLVRDGKRWSADGRGQHLAAAARASRERLGGAPLDLYLLHAPDPQVPFATSVRALAKIVEDGVARRVGMSNVGRVQLAEALAITPIAAVEVELGPHDIDPIRGGLVALCVERGIPVLAHRPLGGPDRARRWGKDREIREIATRHGATPAEIILAWLGALSPVIIPLPGPSTVATAQSAARAAAIVLDDDARRALDARFLGSSAARLSGAPAPAARSDGREVVIVMGMPGAGKSTLARELIGRGYARFNRDERGGTIDALVPALDAALAAGAIGAVLDNTYPTRASRAPVIDTAHRHGVPVRCRWLDTSIEDAQVNAASRLIERYDRLPEPAELNKLSKKDPGAFRPTAQFNWRRDLEPPDVDEGFAAVERVEFVRGSVTGLGDGARFRDTVSVSVSASASASVSVSASASASALWPALIIDLDDLIRVGRPTDADHVALLPGAAAALAAWAAAGWALAATSWLPTVPPTTLAAIDAQTSALLGFPLPIATCPHPAGPPICWCRKPLPGLGLLLARRHRLDLIRSVHIAARDNAADRGFATRLGLRFADPEALLAPPPALH